MRLGFRRPVTLVNGRVVADGSMATSVRFGRRIIALDEAPRRGDLVVDLEGAWVLPGLINAHDHLELNHYGRLLSGTTYPNARAWIDELRPQLRNNVAIRDNQAFPLRHRLFIGALKNVLAGVTLVAHHNPRYGESRHLPVRVLESYGWAHSYALQGHPVGAHGEPGPDVQRAYQATPADVPFIVHAGEGTDREAAEELARLVSDGCLRANTAIVHGVALTESAWARLVEAGASLIWCPTSNLAMLGATAHVPAWLSATPASESHVCLATDSRLTGSRDLLEELRVARDLGVVAADLLPMVTTTAAAILRADAGTIRVGARADVIIVPPTRDTAAESVLALERGDITCVVVDGDPVIGESRLAPLFEIRGTGCAPLRVDGRPLIASKRLTRDIARCPIREPGVEMSA